MRGIVIGHSELEERDAADRRAWGPFRPGFGYELVEPVFRLFSEAVPKPEAEPHDREKLERYYAARDRLGLTLVDATGRELATSGIHIADYTEEQPRAALRLEVLVRDEVFWGE